MSYWIYHNKVTPYSKVASECALYGNRRVTHTLWFV
jgi:hypothetical protein